MLLFPVLLLMALLAFPGLLRSVRLYVVLAGSVGAALGLYLYLLVVAANDPGLGWGGIDSLSLLVRHVTGQQYRQQVGAVPGRKHVPTGNWQ